MDGALIPWPCWLDIRVDAQSKWEVLPGVQRHERFENLCVNPLAGFIGADILSAEDAPDAHDASGKFLVAVSLGGNERRLANAEAGDVDFINIETDAERGVVGKRDDRRIELS